MTAIKLHVHVSDDRIIRLPREVPVGPAEIIVIAQPPARARRRPVGIDAGKGFSVPDDFDDPLPCEQRCLFDGEGS